mgnify:CR=1 FL=1
MNLFSKILQPDKNTFLFKKYHTSSKFLIPLSIASIITTPSLYKVWASDHNWESRLLPPPVSEALYILDFLAITNVGFHSYFSMSSVITDYIKKTPFNTISRVANFKLHSIATIGILLWSYDRRKKDI